MHIRFGVHALFILCGEEAVAPMQSIRCRCGKIVCQVENVSQMPQIEDGPPVVQGPAAVILCRHCKRYVILQFTALSGVRTVSQLQDQASERPLVAR